MKKTKEVLKLPSNRFFFLNLHSTQAPKRYIYIFFSNNTEKKTTKFKHNFESFLAKNTNRKLTKHFTIQSKKCQLLCQLTITIRTRRL